MTGIRFNCMSLETNCFRLSGDLRLFGICVIFVWGINHATHDVPDDVSHSQQVENGGERERGVICVW